MRESSTDTERLAELLAALPPAPQGWVEAAQELPAARRSLDGLIARAEADGALRRRLIADLEATLTDEGIAVTPALLSLARARLGGE